MTLFKTLTYKINSEFPYLFLNIPVWVWDDWCGVCERQEELVTKYHVRISAIIQTFLDLNPYKQRVSTR